LNIATTRMILSNGHEGPDVVSDIISSFGQFVVGGNYVIGVVVFTILVLINFMVVTKGATRVAEVAARFTLDVMPGKQMAIEADLSAGLIDEKTAKEHRKTIINETNKATALKKKEQEASQKKTDKIHLDKFLAMDNRLVIDSINQIPTKEPVFGLDIKNEGGLKLRTFNRAIEQKLLEFIKQRDGVRDLMLNIGQINALIQTTTDEARKLLSHGFTPIVIIVNLLLRKSLSDIFEKLGLDVVILSHAKIDPAHHLRY